jgi:predicted enzyme related to lactoylglutathione lyase
MERAAVATTNKPAWVELSSKDAPGSRDFYGKLFGWDIEVIQDPQYGGYGMARIGGKDVAGIGPTQSPEAPTAWMIYIGTDNADELADKVKAAGGNVIAPPFDVPGQGRMAVFQDPAGAFISAWQAQTMGGFQTNAPNSYEWAELNARGLEKAVPFYQNLFGWTPKVSTADPSTPYTEFQVDGQSIAGAMEMNPMVPAEVPSYWMVYFGVDDVDRSFKQAVDSGAREMLAPQDFPGGRFAILQDPQGAAFGLLKMRAS